MEFDDGEMKYQATIIGQGIRKRCRRTDFFVKDFLVETLEITDDVRGTAKQWLWENMKHVKNAKLRVEEVWIKSLGQGYTSTTHKVNARKLEESLWGEINELSKV